MELIPEFQFSSQNWVILHGFGPFCLDLGRSLGLGYYAEFESEWAPKEMKPYGWGQKEDGRTDQGCTNERREIEQEISTD